MTLQELAAVLTPLALAMRQEVDAPTFRAYHRVLADVPIALAVVAVEQIGRSGVRFFPSAPEIRTACEQVRRQQLVLHQHTACCECEDSKGWRPLTDGTVQRCPCVARHQQALADRGLLAPVTTMSDEGVVGAEAPVVTLDQLPAPVRGRLATIAGGKGW